MRAVAKRRVFSPVTPAEMIGFGFIQFDYSWLNVRTGHGVMRGVAEWPMVRLHAYADEYFVFAGDFKRGVFVGHGRAPDYFWPEYLLLHDDRDARIVS